MTQQSVADDMLRSYVDRLERMHEERKAIAADISDIYAEAKSNGLDVPALKAVLKIRQDMDAHEQRQEIIDLYLSSLGLAGARARVHARNAA